MLTGLLFLGSCQELEQVEPLVEESLDASFDRAKFLNAVNIASNNLQMRTDLGRQFNELNFRTQQSTEEIIEYYITDIANNLNSTDFNFKLIDSEDGNEDDSYFFTYDELPNSVKKYLDSYATTFDAYLQKYQNGEIEDSELIQLFKTASYQAGFNSLYDEDLDMEEKILLSNIFFTSEELVSPTYELLTCLYGAENAFFGGRFGNALGRILLGVAVGAALIAVPVTAIAITKIATKKTVTWATVKIGKKSTAIGYKSTMKNAMLSGIKGQNLATTGALSGGLYAGWYNASKYINEDWKGWDKEIVNTLKYKFKFLW